MHFSQSTTEKKDSKIYWEDLRKAIPSAIRKNREWLNVRASVPPREFDFVVLQSWLDVPDDVNLGYFKYAKKYSEAIKLAGARPVLYLTAPYAHNAAPVSAAVARAQAIGECRAALEYSRKVDAEVIVVPVPLAITLAQESSDPIARTLTFRYKADFHPNGTMAYLTACTLYASLYDKSPEGLRLNKVTETKGQNIHGERVGADAKDKISSQVNPDGGPMEAVINDQERLFLQRMAWSAVKAFRSGAFAE